MTNARAAAALGVEAATDRREDHPTTVSQMLETLRPQIALALPRHMTPDRMLRIVLTEIRKVQKLAQCDRMSLFGAIIQASQLGLEPGSSLGHAYLIPFENRRKGIIECQLLIGYRGMIELARRSGQIQTIYASVVYEKDQFVFELGDEPKLKHVPSRDADPGPMLGAYAVAVMVGGGVQREWMKIQDIEKIRKRSRSGNEGPWVTDYEEMCKKTVVRRMFKYLPVSIELQSTLATVANLDTSVDLGESQRLDQVIDGESREVADTPADEEESSAATPKESAAVS